MPLDAGEISLNGSSISLLPIHKRASLGLSYLPQEASVFRKLTVEENIRAVLELQHGEDGKRLSKDAISSRAEALLDELQIAHLRENPALSLSAASGAGSKSRARWPPTRTSSCSTNRSPASTRSRCSRSRRSSSS